MRGINVIPTEEKSHSSEVELQKPGGNNLATLILCMGNFDFYPVIIHFSTSLYLIYEFQAVLKDWKMILKIHTKTASFSQLNQ